MIHISMIDLAEIFSGRVFSLGRVFSESGVAGTKLDRIVIEELLKDVRGK